jgi:hypothetical protein
MSKIYGLAQRVVVWLGEAADESDLALKDIHAAAGKDPPRKSSRKDETDQKDYLVIMNLLRRPWFERIWVSRQEAQLPWRGFNLRPRYSKKSPRLDMC